LGGEAHHPTGTLYILGLKQGINLPWNRWGFREEGGVIIFEHISVFIIRVYIASGAFIARA
jgi:hypothetical protein